MTKRHHVPLSAIGSKATIVSRALIEQGRRKAAGLPIVRDVPMPPSTNNCYTNVRGRGRVLTSEGKAFKAAVGAMFPKLTSHYEWLEITITLRMPLYYKNGTRRKFDVSNRVKLLEDAVCAALGIDDSAVVRLVVEKVDCGTQGATITVAESVSR